MVVIFEYYKTLSSSSLASCVVSNTDASNFQYGEDPNTFVYQFGIFLLI